MRRDLAAAQRSMNELAGALRTQRAVFKTDARGKRFPRPPDDPSWELDPRVLVFELLTTFMVREQQLDLVENFLKTVESGRSRVVQMIMGGGKTSVVSPLLGLMLANGERLVSLIVPDSLLKQSMDEIQSKFMQIMTKQVAEFRFQRSTDPHDVKMHDFKARAKLLRAARTQGAIYCAGPSSMKSLMLELVDVLQRLETAVSKCDEARPPALAPTTASEPQPENRLQLYDARRAQNRQPPLVDGGRRAAVPAANEGPSSRAVEQYRAREMRHTASNVVKKLLVNPEEKNEALKNPTIHLEEEAEALRDIIGTFGERKGVALIDEVDWILHPLKSELNFPIGEEVRAELSPERWELPTFIFEVGSSG